MKRTLEGVLPVNKPAGWTSHDVVAKMRGILGTRKIGHTGTLDPQVTGVLPLCIGRATRLVEYIQDLPKSYTATMVFGYRTDTEDSSGTVLERCDRVTLSEEEVRSALHRFVGEIEQVPPMYSAVQVDGKRLYEWARSGVEVERAARSVHIYSITIVSMDLSLEHPRLTFEVVCSKGTYVRTLCSDLGQALGFPAVMDHLVRTQTGNLDLSTCATLEEVQQAMQAGEIDKWMLPMDRAMAHLSAWRTVDHAAVRRCVSGQLLEIEDLLFLEGNEPTPGERIRLYSDDDQFLGVFIWAERESQRLMLKAEKVFLPHTDV